MSYLYFSCQGILLVLYSYTIAYDFQFSLKVPISLNFKNPFSVLRVKNPVLSGKPATKKLVPRLSLEVQSMFLHAALASCTQRGWNETQILYNHFSSSHAHCRYMPVAKRPLWVHEAAEGVMVRVKYLFNTSQRQFSARKLPFCSLKSQSLLFWPTNNRWLYATVMTIRLVPLSNSLFSGLTIPFRGGGRILYL